MHNLLYTLNERSAMRYLLFLCVFFMSFSPAFAQKSEKELRKEKKEERKRQRRQLIALSYARYHIILANSKDSTTFDDGNIIATFGLLNGITLTLKNQLDQPIEILWNETSIVMPDGTSEKIIHSGVKYIDRGKEMPNTAIPPGAKIDDKLIPIENVEYRGRYGWGEDPMFRSNSKTKLALRDKTMSVFMPIKLPSGKKNYNFELKIRVY